jgi:hypothetical protein
LNETAINIASNVEKARRLGFNREAIPVWRSLLDLTYVDETDYSDWCRELAEVYSAVGRGLAAGRIYEYLLNIESAIKHYSEFGEERDMGRVLALGRQYAEAADHYQGARLYALAAQSAEKGDDLERAATLYEQLMRSCEVNGNRYLCSLAGLNAGRIYIARSDPKTAGPVLARATQLLDQEADHREQTGDREGAFRCYLSVIKIGMLEKSYENIAQGFLNCIRILKAKSDRFFTMQYYYGLIRESDALEEHHSVAELFREAGEYARRIGFIYADFFLYEAGQAWQNIAAKGLEIGNPTELVENALLAAAGCYNRIQDDHRVAECYQLLTELPLPESQVARFARLAEEVRHDAWDKGVQDMPMAFPAYFRREIEIPEIWTRDLVLSESGQSIPDTIGRLVGDHNHVWDVQRRKALLITLQHDDHLQSKGNPRISPPELILSICELGHPAAVPPLVAIYLAGDESVQLTVLERAPNLKKKEAFDIVDLALDSKSEAIRTACIKFLRRMNFPQALDYLVRIFNSTSQSDIKDACLTSIALIGTDEACEFLLDIIRSNKDNLGPNVRALLQRNAQERMLSALQRNRRNEPDARLAKFLGQLISQIRTRRGTRGI